MKTQFSLFILLFCLIANVSVAKETVGWVEKVLILPDAIEIKAKIDSGARHSSLHCGCTEFTKKNGEEWVRLKIENYKGKVVEIEKPIIRKARIKRHNGRTQVRKVIKLDVCLESVKKLVEVNLIDRGELKYQMLIGRSFLNGDFLIDSENKYLVEPNCAI